MIQPVTEIKLSDAQAIKRSQDEQDAHRMIRAALTLATLPQIASDDARYKVATHLRGMIERHGSVPPILEQILAFVEKPEAW